MAKLDIFFNPKTIAVIGASGNPGDVGWNVIENIKHTFDGTIYPINPSFTEIQGFTSYSSLTDIEEAIDIGIIVLPNDDLDENIKELIKRKIKGLILISGSLNEEISEKRLFDLKKLIKDKIPVIGYNSIGLFGNYLNLLSLSKNKLKQPINGFTGVLTNSKTMGAILIDDMIDRGIGISKFFSISDGISLDENKILKYLSKDTSTRCILLALDFLKDGKEFIRIAKNIVKDTPIVVLKTPKDNVYSTAFEEAGVIEVDDTEELLDFGRVLSGQPFLNGKKIAIFTDSDSLGKLVKGKLVKEGFEVSGFEVSLSLEAEDYEKAITKVLKLKSVDGLICIFSSQMSKVGEGIVEIMQNMKTYGKPLVVNTIGSEYNKKISRNLEKFGIPVYGTVTRAVKALKILEKYKEIKKK